MLERSQPCEGQRRQRWLLIGAAEPANDDEMGGHEVMLLCLAEELSRQGVVEPKLLARPATSLRKRGEQFAPRLDLTPVLTKRGRAHQMMHWAQDLAALIRVLRVEKPDLCILADGCVLAHPLLALTLTLVRQKYAVYVPISEPTTELGFRSGPLRDRAMRWAFAHFPCAWIVLTQDQALSLSNWSGAKVPVLVLPNRVAPRIEAMVGQEEACTLKPRKERRLRVLVLGRLDLYQKGLDLLVNYVEQHASELKGITITLVGEGPGRTFIEAKLRETSSLEELLRIAPWSDPVSAMLEHNVMLLPSRFEGVPLVMLEAMALGLPVVASDLPGTRAFLPPSCLFAVGDLAKAFEQINVLRALDQTRIVIARNRKILIERASSSAYASAVAQLTRALLRTEERSPAPIEPFRASAFTKALKRLQSWLHSDTARQ